MTPAEFNSATAGIAYAPRGAFFSELYLFVSLCVAQGVTRIVESGVHHGVSTRVFRAIWPNRVTSIEFRPDNIPPDLDGIVCGDGCKFVPAIVSAFHADQIGVFIDGPKKEGARLLRAWCLRQPHVRVVAQHDSPIGSGEFAHSYDGLYQSQIGAAIDERIDPAIRSQYIHGCPGMGVWVSA
jgi:hypothetical protein